MLFGPAESPRRLINRRGVETVMSKLRIIREHGIELDLTIYQEMKFDHGTESYLDVSNQNVIRIGEIERFLAHATLDRSRKVVRYDFVVNGRELLSKSRSIVESQPTREMYTQVEKALGDLRGLNDDDPAPKTKLLIDQFRLPSPKTEPELYRVVKIPGVGPRIVVLWGCEGENGKAIPLNSPLPLPPPMHPLKAWLKKYWPLLLGLLLAMAALWWFQDRLIPNSAKPETGIAPTKAQDENPVKSDEKKDSGDSEVSPTTRESRIAGDPGKETTKIARGEAGNRGPIGAPSNLIAALRPGERQPEEKTSGTTKKTGMDAGAEAKASGSPKVETRNETSGTKVEEQGKMKEEENNDPNPIPAAGKIYVPAIKAGITKTDDEELIKLKVELAGAPNNLIKVIYWKQGDSILFHNGVKILSSAVNFQYLNGTRTIEVGFEYEGRVYRIGGDLISDGTMFEFKSNEMPTVDGKPVAEMIRQMP